MPPIRGKVSDIQQISVNRSSHVEHTNMQVQASAKLIPPLPFLQNTHSGPRSFCWLIVLFSLFSAPDADQSLESHVFGGVQTHNPFPSATVSMSSTPRSSIVHPTAAINTLVLNLLIYCMWLVTYNSDWKDFCCQPLIHNHCLIWRNGRKWQWCGSDLHSN